MNDNEFRYSSALCSMDIDSDLDFFFCESPLERKRKIQMAKTTVTTAIYPVSVDQSSSTLPSKAVTDSEQHNNSMGKKWTKDPKRH